MSMKSARKRVLLTGITGQDGAYLAENLVQMGYDVHGMVRRSSSDNTTRIKHMLGDPDGPQSALHLHYGDLTDSANVMRIIKEVEPVEIYNLGAQSHVHVSFEIPEYSANVDALGALRILEAIRVLGMCKSVRFYQASTSELFGSAEEVPQRETTAFRPRSPYAVAKLYSYWITVNYREAYGIHASNGIMFNHESPRRGSTFVTRKISQSVARILLGKQKCVYLGYLDAKRDWGYAKDYVDAMWRIVTEVAFSHVGIEIEWRGEGKDEVGVCSTGILPKGTVLVRIDPRYYRPTEVPLLVGDAAKARRVLNWKPKTTFKELVAMMVDSDVTAEDSNSR